MRHNLGRMMMRTAIAVISDIHGNFPALRSVSRDMAAQQIGEVWCLGDVIGYGADPWGCWQALKSEPNVKLIRGNHEQELIGRDRNRLNIQAKAGVDYARLSVTPQLLAEVAALPFEMELPLYGVALSHGSFSGNHFDYVITESDAAYELEHAPAAINFVGHTHCAFGFGSKSGRLFSNGWRVKLNSDEKYLINPGSVGQPRDRDYRAAYGILEIEDSDKYFSWRRVDYPVVEAAQNIVQAGLPIRSSNRLFRGE